MDQDAEEGMSSLAGEPRFRGVLGGGGVSGTGRVRCRDVSGVTWADDGGMGV